MNLCSLRKARTRRRLAAAGNTAAGRGSRAVAAQTFAETRKTTLRRPVLNTTRRVTPSAPLRPPTQASRKGGHGHATATGRLTVRLRIRFGRFSLYVGCMQMPEYWRATPPRPRTRAQVSTHRLFTRPYPFDRAVNSRTSEVMFLCSAVTDKHQAGTPGRAAECDFLPHG